MALAARAVGWSGAGLLACGWLAGCTVDDLTLTDKSCPCTDGWQCDTSANRCVPAGSLPIDAGPDAAPDAAIDGGCDSDAPWWDASYAYRRRIVVAAGSSPVPARYSLRVVVDHAALVSAGKSQANGADLRVVCSGASQSRLVDRFWAANTSSTTVWFAHPDAVAAAASNEACLLYYGNPTATEPPSGASDSMGADPASQVFTHADDFEEAHTPAEQPDGWTDQGTTDYQIVQVGQNARLRAMTYNAWEDGTVASSMQSVGDAVWSADFTFWQNGENGWGGIGVRVESGSGGGAMVMVHDGGWDRFGEYWVGGYGWVPDSSIHFPFGSTGRLEVVTYGNSLSAYWYNPIALGDRVTILEADPIASSAGKLAVFAERPYLSDGGSLDRWVDADNVIVRPYVSPEPTVALGCELAAP